MRSSLGLAGSAGTASPPLAVASGSCEETGSETEGAGAWPTSAPVDSGGALSAAIAASLDKLSAVFNSAVVSMDGVRRTGIPQFCTRRVNAPLTKVAERVLISWRNFSEPIEVVTRY